jgi:hypothetical protein
MPHQTCAASQQRLRAGAASARLAHTVPAAGAAQAFCLRRKIAIKTPIDFVGIGVIAYYE